MRNFNTFVFLILAIRLMGQPDQLKLLGHWRDSSIVGSSAYNNAFNEVWGIWNKGREYAVIGSTYGTHFIDITDPGKPIEVARVAGGTSGPQVIHRDYDDYQCYLYAVCDEGSRSSLQIIDFSQLPQKVTVVYDSNEHFIRSHNIYIDIPKARLYTCAEGGANGFFALGLYDISDPVKPQFIGHYNRFGGITAGHVHDAFVRNDTAYLNCGNDGFAIVDFRDPALPRTLYTLKPTEYPFPGYNHSGWLTPDGSKYVMADETHGAPMKLIDFSDWDDVRISGLLGVNRSKLEIPHNPLVSCDYAYVAYYYDGVQVYDIRNPDAPERKYYYPTSKIANKGSYEGAWGVYPFFPSGRIAVADMQDGLFIFEGVERPCNTVRSCDQISQTDHATSQIDSDLLISPNPVRDLIQIRSLKSIIKVEIIQAQGQLLKSIQYPVRSEVLEIDASSFHQGLYFVRIYSEDGSRKVRQIHILD
jgi:choice-of-anchor B domain-containing protein